jgi:two-component system OmpR family sensor kinase/two-component system sensor histidine kinase BaeS
MHLYDRRSHRGPFGRFFVAAWIFLIFAIAGAGSAIANRGAMLAVGLGAFAVLLAVAVGRTAARVDDVMAAADRVAAGDYDVRVPERGPASVRAMARSFNTMAGRLKSHDRLRRDLMADVAHELRTPLTVIQGKLEGLIDGVYPRDPDQLQQLLEETRVLARLVEDLRTLALSESGALKLQREPTDVAALGRDVAAALAGEASARGVALTVDAPQEIAPMEIDPVRIREVIANLVSNAVRHTPAGGSVTVSLTAPDRSRVQVQVRDTGSGMSPDEVAHAFDRFYKGQGSRGSGLGLTIAKNLITAHGGEIRAASEIGRGTTITFTIPIG